MALKFYRAIGDTGGVKGDEISSGVKGVLLPLITSTDRANGVIIHRKIYIETDAGITLFSGINGYGQFSASWFKSASDAEVVGDLTGTEIKYGASQIIKLEDSLSNIETENGAGGLSDIRKITVLEDPTGDVFFRAGDQLHIDNNIYVIDVVTYLAGECEIALTANAPYFYAIGKYAYSNAENTLLATESDPFWLKVTVPAGTITTDEFNTFSIMTVF